MWVLITLPSVQYLSCMIFFLTSPKAVVFICLSESDEGRCQRSSLFRYTMSYLLMLMGRCNLPCSRLFVGFNNCAVCTEEKAIKYTAYMSSMIIWKHKLRPKFYLFVYCGELRADAKGRLWSAKKVCLYFVDGKM